MKSTRHGKRQVEISETCLPRKFFFQKGKIAHVLKWTNMFIQHIHQKYANRYPLSRVLYYKSSMNKYGKIIKTLFDQKLGIYFVIFFEITSLLFKISYWFLLFCIGYYRLCWNQPLKALDENCYLNSVFSNEQLFTGGLATW